MADVKPLIQSGGSLTEMTSADRVVGHVKSDTLKDIVPLTKAAYDALSPPDANTLYFITDAVPAFYLLNQIIVSANITLGAGNVWCRVRTGTAAITITLPASPNDGDIVQFTDSDWSVADNNLTIARNGNNIGGLASDLTLDTVWTGPLSFVFNSASSNWEFA